ncbi:Gfo/Idh/MocA family protein [Caldisphaera lagunensis]|uniref:Gfo/Idh/MocA family protein n=1 Tax=Caldisphaera lagunensis TaxID=200415 RepID=UPI00066247CC|nr:Gfo/Idh/MocA family oxidoreductase [Caldisphaera lagunensis]
MKIAVVGSRGFGRVHLYALNKLKNEGYDLKLYVFSSDKSEAEKLGKEFMASGIFTSYDEILSSDVDIVDLIVSHDSHLDMSVKAMERKKHVILEKPIARTVEEATKIIEKAKISKVKFMVAENYYFDSSIRKAVELTNNELGKIYSIIVRYSTYNQPRTWRKNKQSMGGGALIDGGIHFVDAMLNLGGSYDKICSISYKTYVDMEGEDTTVAIINFKNGAKGTLIFSWGMNNSPLVPAFEVYGEKGTIYEDPYTRKVEISGKTKYVRRFGDIIYNNNRVEIPDSDSIKDELKGFIDSIINETQVPMPPEIALRDLRAVLDIYDSNCFKQLA